MSHILTNLLFSYYRPYKLAPERRLILTSILVALYAISLPYCYFTSGEPRRIAMINAQRLADEKWEKESLLVLENENNNITTTIDQLIIDTSTISTIPNATNTFTTTTSSVESTLPLEEDTPETYTDPSMTKKQNTGILSWFGPNREQKKAQFEFEKWQKSFKEKMPEG